MARNVTNTDSLDIPMRYRVKSVSMYLHTYVAKSPSTCCLGCVFSFYLIPCFSYYCSLGAELRLPICPWDWSGRSQFEMSQRWGATDIQADRTLGPGCIETKLYLLISLRWKPRGCRLPQKAQSYEEISDGLGSQPVVSSGCRVSTTNVVAGKLSCVQSCCRLWLESCYRDWKRIWLGELWIVHKISNSFAPEHGISAKFMC